MSETRRRRIDIVQEPSYVEDLASLPIDELRSRRRTCADLDTELSYYRRLLHGRMDLLGFEQRRRSGEEERSLLEALPEILAQGTGSNPGLPARAIAVEIPDLPEIGRRAVDRVLGDDFLAHLPTLSDDELEETLAQVAEVEEEISRQRKAVYAVYDLLQAELTRRYREGLADPGELLGSGSAG
ncbi:MAG TPA: aerial mycelium formation protein [Acidimicrobiia bacterium]|nr:aerial mycelium formation protein [Acidimicrobiia bacterium]